MIQHTELMRSSVPEFLTGNSPVLFGGDTQGNDTASGIATVKDSAFGRLALFKRAQNEFYAQTMLNAIDCFRENRTDDVTMALLGAGNTLDTKLIKLADLRGNLYARTEADQSYPTSPTQRRSLILNLLQNPNPVIQQTITAPDNFDALKAALALHDLKLPGEDARMQQRRENELIAQGINPQVDVLLDQHDYHMGALQEWVASDEGQLACQDPNVKEMARQHMMQHITAKGQQAMIAAGQTNVGAAAGVAPPPPPQQGPPPPQTPQ
jgi:hypothetical protein